MSSSANVVSNRDSVLQCVAVCCSVLQCVACVAVCCSKWRAQQFVVVQMSCQIAILCCSVLECFVVCCSVLQ